MVALVFFFATVIASTLEQLHVAKLMPGAAAGAIPVIVNRNYIVVVLVPEAVGRGLPLTRDAREPQLREQPRRVRRDPEPHERLRGERGG